MVLPGKTIRCRRFFVALYRNWDRHDLGDVAGALTFQAVLAFFPFLLFCVSLASLVMDPSAAEVLVQELAKVAPPEVAAIVGGELRSLVRGKRPALLTISIIGAIWASASGVAALIRALNRVNGVTESRPFWRTRLLSIEVTLGAAALVVVSIAFAVMTRIVARRLPYLASIMTSARLPLAGLVMMIVLASLYRVLPNVDHPFRLVTPGSIVGVLLWLAASVGFSLYVGSFGRFEITYGALGGVVVLLLWMWISALATLLGAEINAILDGSTEPAPIETKPPPAPLVEQRALVVAGARPPVQIQSPWRRVGLTVAMALGLAAMGAAFMMGARRSR